MAFTPVELYAALDNNYPARPNFLVQTNNAINRRRVFTYGGDLYAIIVTDNYSFTLTDPEYFATVVVCERSTDGGATWTEQDVADHPISSLTGTSGYGEAVVQVGSVLWVFFNYGEHVDLGGGNFTGQFDRINAVFFDMATQQWGAAITSGPLYAPATSAYDPRGLSYDAAYRGSDEIIVYHNETDDAMTYRRSMYSIFNTASQTWTTTDVVVFDATEPLHITAGSCVFDGTYTHFTAPPEKYFSSSTTYKPHRTLDSGNSLGTTGNMLAAYPGGLPPVYASTAGFNDALEVFGGEVFCAQAYYGYDRWAGFYYDPFVLMYRAPSGVAAPSWTVEDIDSAAWSDSYDFQGQSGVPAFVQSDGDLYVLHGGYLFGLGGYNPAFSHYFIFAQKYLGSGVWDAPEEFWDYRDTFGGTSGGFVPDDVFKLSAIGDLGGAGISGIGLIASMLAYWETDSVYWFSSGATPTCCCADFAY
jgi:hypothetical protein